MNENEFGYRVRQALNEAAERLDYTTTYRLEKARSAALARQRAPGASAAWLPVPQTAGVPSFDTGSGAGWLRGLGLVTPLVALIVGFIGIYQWQEERRISELADLDFAVLLDEVPIDAYADKGFSVLLQGETDEL
jgi:hypothetical protein